LKLKAYSSKAVDRILTSMADLSRQAQIPPRGEHLLLYDGLCGLCNRLNSFVLSRDTRGAFDFASLQSAVGQSTLQRFGRNPENLTTLCLVTNYRFQSQALLLKAGAVLFVMKQLGPPWSWLAVFGVFPSTLLDRVYDWIARNRYRFFGRYESCPIPNVEHKKRFIDV
jgi:predicted DCC family thiol-disulfide oxidoreductase YuxK